MNWPRYAEAGHLYMTDAHKNLKDSVCNIASLGLKKTRIVQEHLDRKTEERILPQLIESDNQIDSTFK